MSSTPAGSNGASGAPPVPMRFEVTVLAVADVDRAKAFYERLGWRLDADFPLDEDDRIVQLTPPGSPASIQFGTGVTTMAPGSVKDMYLVVDDIAAARDELIGHGADVTRSGRPRTGSRGPPSPAAPRTTARTAASPRSPTPTATAGYCRRSRSDSPAGSGSRTSLRAQLLHETAIRHGAFEAVAPPHDWWDWYAAYMDAREQGSTPEEAAANAGRYMAEVKHVEARA